MLVGSFVIAKLQSFSYPPKKLDSFFITSTYWKKKVTISSKVDTWASLPKSINIHTPLDAAQADKRTMGGISAWNGTLEKPVEGLWDCGRPAQSAAGGLYGLVCYMAAVTMGRLRQHCLYRCPVVMPTASLPWVRWKHTLDVNELAIWDL